MIKRATWIMLVILVLVIVAYFVVKNISSTALSQATPTSPGNNFLITKADGILQILRIFDMQDQPFQMQRDTSSAWIITLPIPGFADQTLAGAAETQVGALRIVTALDNSLILKDAGLDSPSYTIELTFEGDKKHIMQIGSLTPTKSGYYVHFDSVNLFVVAQSGIDALLNLLNAPPFPATATAIPTDEQTRTPT